MPFLLPLIPSSRNFYAHIEYFRNRFKWPSLEFVAFLFHFNVSSCWSETRKWKFTKLNKSSGWGIKSFKWLSENTWSESLKHATGQLNMEAIWYIDQIFRFMHQDGLEMSVANSAVSFTEIPYFSKWRMNTWCTHMMKACPFILIQNRLFDLKFAQWVKLYELVTNNLEKTCLLMNNSAI